MKYYERVIQPDEHIKFIGRLHWVIYKYAILLGILAIAAAIFALKLSDEQRPLALIGSAILAIIAIVIFIRHLFRQWTTEIVVTDKRIIYKLHFIARFTEEMNITKVETVIVEQSFWGRILGYGKVVAKGTGQTMEFLDHVASPLELRSAILVG